MLKRRRGWRLRTALTAITMVILASSAPVVFEQLHLRNALADDPQLRAASGVHFAQRRATVGALAAPLGGANVNASSNGSAQNETTIAINPTNGNNIIGGSNDYSGTGPNGNCGRYRSTDGGATWTRTLMPQADAGFASAGDPGVAFDANGNAYYLCMNFNGGANDATQYVHKSLDGGATWGPPILAAGNVRANFDDKGHLAVDNISSTAHRGNVYLSFSRINAGEIRFNRSTDGGATFNGCPAACADFVVSDGNPGVVQGSNIAVGPGGGLTDGAVYVAWADNDGAANSRIRIDKSTNGGVSFGALTGGTDHTIRNNFQAIGNPDLNIGGVRPLARVNSFPVIKTHQTNVNIVYAVWAENPAGADDSDIMFARSVDGGNTWGAPKRINDDVNPAGSFNSQFFPWMAVDPTDGEIDIVWYDDRNWNKSGNPLVDLYFASSKDDGISFSASKRISTASSDVTVEFGTPFFGDYNGIDARGGIAMPLWTQTTGGDQEAFTTQVGGANLAITKTDSPDPVNAGGDLVYTINVSNAGPAVAFNTRVVDTLPGAVNYVANTDSCVEGPTGTLTCSLGNLASGASTSFTISVTVDPDAPASITNTAVVSSDQEDPNTANNTATAGTLVRAEADLRILKECKPDQPNKQPAGTPTFCEIYVDNLGPSDAQDVVITDRIISSTPVTITAVTTSSTSGPAPTCLPVPPIGPTSDTTITCNDAVLPAGARDTIRVTFVANATGDVNDTASVRASTPDPNPSNNSATGRVSFASSADLAVSKTDAPDPVLAGTNLTYTVSVSNAGPSAAPNVVFTDVLSGQTTFVSATPSQGVCLSGVVPGDPTKPLTCNLGSLASGPPATVTVVVTVKPSVPAGTIIVNNAEVKSDAADPNTGNNVFTATTNVATNADLAITKTSDADQYKPNTTITYHLTVTNNGPSDAQVVKVVDTLPEQKQAVYLSDTGGCVFQAPKTLTCNLATIPANTSKDFFIKLTVKGAQGDVINTAVVSSSTTDPAAPNNTASKTVTIKGGKP